MFGRNFFGFSLLLCSIALWVTGTANAQLTGRKMIVASGGAIDTMGLQPEFGHFGVAGVAVFKNNGTANYLNVTVEYQDSFKDTDGFTCVFNQPGDLTYSFPNGPAAAGTLTLTRSEGDPDCYQTAFPDNTAPETGKSISFVVYAFSGNLTLVGTSTTLIDVDGDQIDFPLAGSGTNVSAGSGGTNTLSGTRLLSAEGGTSDNNSESSDSGHMGLAGRITFNSTGGASALDVTLSYQDSLNDGFVCEFTNPNDLTYSVSNGLGTLTLTLSPGDPCFAPLEGTAAPKDLALRSITFSVYSFGSNASIISTASTLQDSFGDVIDDPVVVGSF